MRFVTLLVVFVMFVSVEALASEEAPRSDAPVISIETLKKIRDCVRAKNYIQESQRCAIAKPSRQTRIIIRRNRVMDAVVIEYRFEF